MLFNKGMKEHSLHVYNKIYLILGAQDAKDVVWQHPGESAVESEQLLFEDEERPQENGLEILEEDVELELAGSLRNLLNQLQC